MFTFINISLLCISLIHAASIKQGGLPRQTNGPILELPARQAQQLGYLFAAKNVSIALEFKQAPGSSGTLVSINAGNIYEDIHYNAQMPRLCRQQSRSDSYLLHSWHGTYSVHEQRWRLHAR